MVTSLFIRSAPDKYTKKGYILRMETGRNVPCPCGSLKTNGKSKKYKHCCLEKDRKRRRSIETISLKGRNLFVSGPYKKCPNQPCGAENSFGLSMSIVGDKKYSRECVICKHKKYYDFPKIKKKIVYLDQFIISNLVKLLDTSHPSHKSIKEDSFWHRLFEKLEVAIKSQVIVCPDSFYHRDESLTGKIDFELMRRVYEHFSNGKTLEPLLVIQNRQILHHFESWIINEKAKFVLDPEEIGFGESLHDWVTGLRVSVGGKPRPDQIENLRATNAQVKEQLDKIWTKWKSEKDVGFIEKVRGEVMALGRGIVGAAQNFYDRRTKAITRMASGDHYDLDLDDIIPPMTNDLLDDMYRVLAMKNIISTEATKKIAHYFTDVNALLDVPVLRISSVMYAGLARNAGLGTKEPPKSIVDINFISSYLPYCDALFIDISSASLLTELPIGTPSNMRLGEYKAKIFTKRNREEFLLYLDQLVDDIPSGQKEILKDLGKDEIEPYWNIVENEKNNH